MQNPFYTSGFLYSLKTHQILLISSPQIDEVKSLYSMLGGESKEGEDAQTAFQRIIEEELNVCLDMKHIYPIYDYFHESLDKTNFVFYAEVKNPKVLDALKDNFSWLAFSQTLKLSFTSQTKQDIVVGERVINAKWRDDYAKKASE